MRIIIIFIIIAPTPAADILLTHRGALEGEQQNHPCAFIIIIGYGESKAIIEMENSIE